MMCETKIPCPVHREDCCVQRVEAEMQNFKLRETARKVYHTQQALKDFQSSTPGNCSTF